MPDPKEYRTTRDGLVRAMRRELFGPTIEDAAEGQKEALDISPLQVYGAGILFPRKLRQESLEDDDPENQDSSESSKSLEDEIDDTIEANDAGNRRASGNAPDAGIDEQPLNLANEFSPSAVGITFRVQSAKTLVAIISFATYTEKSVKEPHPSAGKTRADGTPYPSVREFKLYERIPRSETVEFSINATDAGTIPFTIPRTEDGLKLNVIHRASGHSGSVISVMLVNCNESDGAVTPEAKHCFFQVGFEVRDLEGKPVFSSIDRPSGVPLGHELASLDLLYRHRRSYCLGHGCAGDWRRGEDVERAGLTDVVRTSAIPTYEVQPVEPRTRPYGDGALNLSMKFLSEGAGGDERGKNESICNALDVLCEDYGRWIADQDNAARALAPEYGEAADRHLKACWKCHDRMKAGIDQLRQDSDDAPMIAFRLANQAMLMQQVHTGIAARDYGSEYPEIPADYDEGGGKVRAWRPFQLAFILMNIAGLDACDHPDRELVDLIWFPTGGGKTEAYLGLAAYAICLRRLRSPSDAGTTVLMRYTLRLLTAQQFQRASALILALDILRTQKHLGANLGDTPISIGLWVGKSLSPNSRTDALTSLRQMRKESHKANNPFQVLHCPWCKCELKNKDHLGYEDEKIEGTQTRTVVFRCPDKNCEWGKPDVRMPITVVDEDIYESPPTLVLGTVDKFAQVAWDDRVGRIFGKGLSYNPPELIIQDELHLISGPLGTIVGLYESVIEKFCKSDDRTPKIVASTATIRQARQQCYALYHRDTFEFPPQGLKAGDSYFAFENADAPGRLYAGVFASGLKSHATAQVRTCSALLQHVIPLPESGTSELPETVPSTESRQGPVLPPGTYFPLSDPYGTLVWYFNSLRELGYATTLVSGDIPEYLKSMCRRGDIPWDYRRRIRNYVELTSRRTADEIPDILEQLERGWMPKPEGKGPVDILLATNMISVGVDVPRLGLMVVTGQPKTTSEYIQATSRVGRRFPGLVVTIYNTAKSRDRSHYEQFIAYHQSFYRFVEATSITPFSPPARDRGLRGVLISLARVSLGLSAPDQMSRHRAALEGEVQDILDRISDIDPDELNDSQAEFWEAMDRWEAVSPPQYGKMAGKVDTTTLAYPYGSTPDPIFHEKSWPVLTSMRNVDGTAEGRVIHEYSVSPEDSD